MLITALNNCLIEHVLDPVIHTVTSFHYYIKYVLDVLGKYFAHPPPPPQFFRACYSPVQNTFRPYPSWAKHVVCVCSGPSPRSRPTRALPVSQLTTISTDNNRFSCSELSHLNKCDSFAHLEATELYPVPRKQIDVFFEYHRFAGT